MVVIVAGLSHMLQYCDKSCAVECFAFLFQLAFLYHIGRTTEPLFSANTLLMALIVAWLLESILLLCVMLVCERVFHFCV